MKNRLWLVVGVFLGFVSAYPIVVWIFIFNLYPNNSTLEKKSLFFKEFLFGMNVDNAGSVSLVSILLGLASMTFFGLLVKKYGAIRDKRKSIICLILLILFSVTTMMTLFTIL